MIPITVISLSTIFLLTFSKRKPIMPPNSLLKEAPLAENELTPQEIHQPTLQENTIISCADCSCECDDSVEAVSSAQAEKVTREAATKGKGEETLMASQDLYSESESMDQCSSTSSEDHSSDMEWPYNMGQRVDCSDGSISDEESLIEIAIPSGQFVSHEKDLRWNVKCCKLSQDFCDQESMYQKDFWAEIYEMNEEDNLIEIDINIGSIKCSSFQRKKE